MEFTQDSATAVPELTGVGGTILLSCLILLVIAVPVGVIAAVVARKGHHSELFSKLLLVVVRVCASAAVMASLSALVVAGSTLVTVPRMDVAPVPPSVGDPECGSEQIGPLGDNRDEIAAIADWDPPRGASLEAVRYWPDPSQGCAQSTVDPCRMVSITGNKPADGALGNLTDQGFSEWVKPVGECSTGEPEQVEF